MPRPKLMTLQPGPLEGDWFSGQVPANIEVGSGCKVDSSFTFKHFYSTQPIGLRAGHHVTLWRANLATEEQGVIEIGDECYVANASLVCQERITLGDRVLVGGGVTIADSDFHPLQPAARMADSIALSTLGERHQRPPVSSQPVVIESDVWIGFNAVILKGVHVGAGAVIEPGAVVNRNVEAGTRVGGNPARLWEDGA